MNERIQTLMGKTLDSEFSYTWDTVTYEDLQRFSEKFAELIVLECAEVSKNYAHGSMPVLIAYAIKEHFGVDE